MQPMPHPSLAHCARTAARAAREAGTLIAKFAGRPSSVTTKRSANDLVTEIDRASERLIHRRLHRAFPTFGFVGEEHGRRRQTAPSRWIVDPVDGTINFVHGMPFFGVSIGLEHQGSLVVGVIYDPLRRHLFVGTRGGGAWLNGKRLRASRNRTLGDSLLSTGFSSKFRRQPQPYLRWFQALEARSHAVRRLGSTALCLAYVAAGWLDGFYERDLWPWDIAAGLLLVEEAGGRVSDFKGKPVALTRGRVVASNGLIHDEMLRVLRGL